MPYRSPAWVTTAQEAIAQARDGEKVVSPNRVTFTDDEWQDLCTHLSTNSQVESINFGNMDIPTSRLESLARSIRGKDTIKQLNFLWVTSHGKGLLTEGTWFQELVPTLANLDCLVIERCQLNTRGALELAAALVNNTTIDYLGIYGNPNVGDEGYLDIIKVLRGHPKLKVLHLSNCGITELHREWLQCPKGMQVDIRRNPIETQLSVELASALQSHDVIEGLPWCPKFIEANNIPKEYRSSTKDILRYIVLAGDGHTKLHRGRVVMIGDHGQGKSWLARNLRESSGAWKQTGIVRWVNRLVVNRRSFSKSNDPQQRPPSRLRPLPSTHVMETTELVSGEVTILMQDLGGQHVYRTLQALLLHGSPLYVYCANLADATADADGLHAFEQSVQGWLDVLVACHDTVTRVKLVATHADVVGSADEIKRRLVLLRERFERVIRANECDDVVRLVDGAVAVDNYDTLRCWTLSGSTLVDGCFADLTKAVTQDAMACAETRYDPSLVPVRWISVYKLITKQRGVLMSWSDLAAQARTLDPPIASDDELEFVLRLVREWTGIVSFRDSPYDELHGHVFLDSAWFVEAAGALFIIHHHLQHDSFSEIRTEYGVRVVGHLDDEFDSREAPALPVAIGSVRRHLRELFQRAVLTREFLSQLMDRNLRALNGFASTDDALSFLISVFRELDIIVPLPQAEAGSGRWLCPSLMSMVEVTLSDAIQARFDCVRVRGHCHEYSLPRGMSQVFYRIVNKLCGDVRLQATEPVVIDHGRALWADKARPDAHMLLVRYEHGIAPRLVVHTLGETAGDHEHEYCDAVDDVLGSATLWQERIRPTARYECVYRGCDGYIGENGDARRCDVDPQHVWSEDEKLYGDKREGGAGSGGGGHAQGPFVFVSYAWGDVTTEWVQKKFVPELRRRVGAQVRIVLDIDPESAAQQVREGKNAWMARMPHEASLVIVVCSPGYVTKANSGGGVYFEYPQILERLLSRAKPVAMVLKDGLNADDSIPTALKAKSIAFYLPRQWDALTTTVNDNV